jgi:hypothetical protein
VISDEVYLRVMKKMLIILCLAVMCVVTNSSVWAATRPLKYYGVDRVESMDDANYKVLSEHAVKTVVQYLNPAASTTTFKNLVTLSEKYNMEIVIFPGGSDVSGCGWETPFNNPVNGDYIGKVKSMLDYFDNVSNWPGGRIRVVGIVSSHEPMWNQVLDTRVDAPYKYKCHTQIADLAAIKSQLKNYVNRAEFKVWSYIDNVSDVSVINDYSGPGDYEKIMDVAATWQHCFGGAEGSCPGALAKINKDRQLLNNAGLEGKVELVFLMQTFAQDGGWVMPTYDQLLTESQNFLNSGALDGFIYYTWGACWYVTDLGCPSVTSPKNSNLWPIMNLIADKYINGNIILTVTPTKISPTPTVGQVTPTTTAGKGDANGDGKVDLADFAIWKSEYLDKLGIKSDFNKDNKIDLADFAVWKGEYLKI